MSGHRRTWETFEAMKLAAEEGDPQAQCYLGVCFKTAGRAAGLSGGGEMVPSRGRTERSRRAVLLRRVLFERCRVPQEFGEAAKWLREAAEQNDPAAQFNLGMLYETGQGVTQNYAEAVKWYREAAERGYPAAQFNLGVFYESGRSCRKISNWPSMVSRRRRTGMRARAV